VPWHFAGVEHFADIRWHVCDPLSSLLRRALIRRPENGAALDIHTIVDKL
jgi:hypothetical protein